MHGRIDPYEPRRTCRGQADSSDPAPGESRWSSGRHAAEPEWSSAGAEESGYRRYSFGNWTDGMEPQPHRLGADAYPTRAGRHSAYDRPDLSARTENEPHRQTRPLLLAAIAAAATLLMVVGIGGLLLHPSEGVPTAAAGDGTAAATGGPGRAGAAGAASDLPSRSAATPARSSAPASRAFRAAAQPAQTLAPRPTRTASRAPRPTRSTPASATSTTSPAAGSAAQRVVALVNEERADAGCDRLTVDSRLTTAAQLHSEDQAKHKTMSHDGSDGSTLAQRIDRVGYEWRTIGENVAYGQTTASQVMDAWMNSDGHRQNILNCEFEDIGVGMARDSDGRLYWTQDFGA